MPRSMNPCHGTVELIDALAALEATAGDLAKRLARYTARACDAPVFDGDGWRMSRRSVRPITSYKKCVARLPSLP